MTSVVDWGGEAQIMALDVPINYLLKAWATDKAPGYARVLAVGLGALQYWLYGNLIRKSGLVLNSNAWDALSAMATTAMGVLVFGETMTPRQWLGTGLIVAGLALL